MVPQQMGVCLLDLILVQIHEIVQSSTPDVVGRFTLLFLEIEAGRRVLHCLGGTDHLIGLLGRRSAEF